ncbi:MAG: DUF2252 domain-containing protein [Streptosporangiaceae bacterium]
MTSHTLEPPPLAARPGPADRARLGKAARKRVPRESHASWDPPPSRPDPVDLLASQAASRVPELVPVRYARMLTSPFSYYRGAALPMATDLAGTPQSGITVQACGDAHLSNFGVFGTPERRLAFDVNDFDETLPGPWEWDVKRLAASLEVAGRQNGFSQEQRRVIVLASVRAYREAMRDFAPMGELDVWYAQTDVERLREELDPLMGKIQRKRWDKGEAKARTSDSAHAVKKLTEVVGDAPRFVADPPLIVPLRDLRTVDPAERQSWFADVLDGYRRSLQSDRRVLIDHYDVVDVARKVVGVGSVGTRCWIVLLTGRHSADPLVLQIKEAQDSVLAPYAGPSVHDNQGERVIAGQRLMQSASDIFLGWHRVTALDGQQRDFYVRQLRDWKYSVDIDIMVPLGMELYGRTCGWTLARAHARSGDRIAIAAYLGKSDVFDQAITEFAAAYADQNDRDHQALAAAATSGRIQTADG